MLGVVKFLLELEFCMISVVKAAVINIFIVTVDRTSMCNMIMSLGLRPTAVLFWFTLSAHKGKKL